MKITEATLMVHYVNDEGIKVKEIINIGNNCDASCFIKGKLKGEPTFTLRGQDASAATTIRQWLQNNPQLSTYKHNQALKDIERFEQWPNQKKAD